MALDSFEPNYPWQASYAAHRAMAWNDSIYPKERLRALEAVQEANRAAVLDYMGPNKPKSKPKPKVEEDEGEAGKSLLRSNLH